MRAIKHLSKFSYVFIIIQLCMSSCSVSQNIQDDKLSKISDSEEGKHDFSIGYPLTIQDFGAKGDGITDDIDAIEKTIAAGVNPIIFPFGKYKISRSINIPTRTLVIGNKSTILYRGSGAALKALVSKDNKLSLDCEIRDLFIDVMGDGVRALDASNFQYGSFTGLAIKISGNKSVGIYLQGNGKGTAPYYNNFSNSYIIGDNDSSKSYGQIGICLDDNARGGFTASGANANNFSDFKRIAGVAVGIDLIAGTGNMFENIQTESIQNVHYRLNYRMPDIKGSTYKVKRRNTFGVSDMPQSRKNGDIVFKTSRNKIVSSKVVSIVLNEITIENSLSEKSLQNVDYEFYEAKAAGNKFINLRGEGSGTSAYIRLCYGAMDNSFKDFEYTSLAAGSIIRETNSLSNIIGNLTPIVLFARNVQANTTTKLIPFSGPQGGIPIATKLWVDGIHIKAANQGKGKCMVKAMRNSGEIDLAPYLSTENGFSNFEILKNYDSRSNARLRPGDGLQLELITDKDWTPNDITVTVWLAK